MELEHRLTLIEDAVKDLETAVNSQEETQTKLVIFMSKYEARWGFLFMLGTALWAVFVVFKDEILKLFGRH